jgi:hypothetical protein
MVLSSWCPMGCSCSLVGFDTGFHLGYFVPPWSSPVQKSTGLVGIFLPAGCLCPGWWFPLGWPLSGDRRDEFYMTSRRLSLRAIHQGFFSPEKKNPKQNYSIFMDPPCSHTIVTQSPDSGKSTSSFFSFVPYGLWNPGEIAWVFSQGYPRGRDIFRRAGLLSRRAKASHRSSSIRRAFASVAAPQILLRGGLRNLHS